MSTPITRLRQIAKEAREAYDRGIEAGGEPFYPNWIADIEVVCSIAEQALNIERESAGRD